ncbi:unnamed protein product [Durusdinium trenchii]|uniref:Uncharacterized protein n=2 Tax=Durusdinium trenchii TaxID=1381693 RepID=A0ABP0RE68_9DINO
MASAAEIPWKLWASDDDSVGLVFGELEIQHGLEWFDWRLGDRCGEELIVAHDLKTPRAARLTPRGGCFEPTSLSSLSIYCTICGPLVHIWELIENPV